MLSRPKIHGFLQYSKILLIKLNNHKLVELVLKESTYILLILPLMALVTKENIFPRQEDMIDIIDITDDDMDQPQSILSMSDDDSFSAPK